MTSAVAAIATALNRFSILFVFYHFADNQCDYTGQYRQYNYGSHRLPPYSYFTYATFLVSTFRVVLSL